MTTHSDIVQSATAPSTTLQPLTLPRGHNARIDWLQGNRLHFKSGRQLTIGFPLQGKFNLVGRSTQGVLVARLQGRWANVFVIGPRGGVKPLAGGKFRLDYGYQEGGWGVRLSDDGSRIAVSTYDRGGSGNTVYTLDHQRLTSRFSGWFALPRDIGRDSVVDLSDDYDQAELEGKLLHTTYGGGYQVLPEASWADIERNLLWVDRLVNGQNRSGPTSLGSPSTPLWLITETFIPSQVSADGTKIIGVRYPTKRAMVVEVRSMATGRVIDSWRVRHPVEAWSVSLGAQQTIRFESTTTVIFEATPRRRRGVLVRCVISGPCQRASKLGVPISTSHESWWW